MEQRAQPVKRSTQIVATLVVNGDTMQKIEGLHDVDYAVLVTPSLYGRGDYITGMAVTCHNERRPFRMPIKVFDEVLIEQHEIAV